MKSRFLLSAFMILSVLGGAIMGAKEAHPKGPDTDRRPWVTRIFQIEGHTHAMHLSIEMPEPRPDGSFDGETMFDPMQGRIYTVWYSDINSLVFNVDYPFRGHFWQGIFGSVDIRVEVVKRERHLEFDPRFEHKPIPSIIEGSRNWNGLIQRPWDSLEDVRRFWEEWNAYTNAEQIKSNRPEGRQISAPPVILNLNGTFCVQIIESKGRNIRDVRKQYFLLEPDSQVELSVELTDNSDRPGLTASDWRPRAEAIADKILQGVKVRIE